MRRLLASSLRTARFGPEGWQDPGGEGSTEAEFIDWLTFRDARQSLAADIGRLRAHPLVSRDIAIHGFLYDVRTGRLETVEEAAAARKAS
jgi:carbonic anhydrase